MTNSPLGQYAPFIAATTAILIIGGYVLALIFGTQLGISQGNIEAMRDFAFIAAGAVFGSAVAVNGWKQPLTATHTRLDAISRQVNSLQTQVGANQSQSIQQQVNTLQNQADTNAGI